MERFWRQSFETYTSVMSMTFRLTSTSSWIRPDYITVMSSPSCCMVLECWRVIKIDMSKIVSFHDGFLQKIYRIFWPNSNRDLYRKKNHCQSVGSDYSDCWLGHVLRMDQVFIPKVAFRWTPSSKKTWSAQNHLVSDCHDQTKQGKTNTRRWRGTAYCKIKRQNGEKHSKWCYMVYVLREHTHS